MVNRTGINQTRKPGVKKRVRMYPYYWSWAKRDKPNTTEVVDKQIGFRHNKTSTDEKDDQGQQKKESNR